MTPNELIRDLRKRLGMTQDVFARESGVHKVHLSKIENGPEPRIGHRVGLRFFNRWESELKVMGKGLEDLLSYENSADTEEDAGGVR